MTFVDCPYCKKEMRIEASVDWEITYDAKENKKHG